MLSLAHIENHMGFSDVRADTRRKALFHISCYTDHCPWLSSAALERLLETQILRFLSRIFWLCPRAQRLRGIAEYCREPELNFLN